VTSLRPDADHPEVKVRALRVDPRTILPAGAPGTNAETPTVATFVAPRAAHAERRAWFASGVFLVGAGEPGADATTLADGVSVGSPAGATARAAVGVQDEDGMLDWVELAPEVPATEQTAKILDALLVRAGCSSRMLVTGDSHALLGGTLDLAAHPFEAAVGATAARLVRASAPSAHVAFESTPIVPPAVWQPLESQRVRYFRRPPKKTAAATPSGSPSALPAFLTAADSPATTPAAPAAPPSPPPAPAPKPHATPQGHAPTPQH
jgi:hypothetical protein